ncbi:hypothetical protein OIU92_13075 [Escherichia coli]|nr:hypothetical protein [Escherichia coli]
MGHAAYGFAGEQKRLVSDLLEAIDIPGSEIIAIMLANFLRFKPASEDILP